MEKTKKQTKLSFVPLFKLMLDRGLKKTELVKDGTLSGSTLAKLGRNEYVSLEVIEKLCVKFNVPIQDIIVYVP